MATSLFGKISSERRLGELRRAGVSAPPLRGIHLDDGCSISSRVIIGRHASLEQASVGRFTSIGRFTKLYAADVGGFCSVAWDVTVGANNHPSDRVSSHLFPIVPEMGGFTAENALETRRVRIGNDVWIGCGATVLSGADVGDGAVIGAGAVVLGDVGPYDVFAGVPAKRIGARVSESTARRLQAIAWWDWPTSTIRQNIELFQRPLDEDVLVGLERVARVAV